MIDIDRAHQIIKESLTCEILDKEINREGTYLCFEELKAQNHLNIDYIFSVYVAIASFIKNKTAIYKRLNQALNEINSSENIELISCKPFNFDTNLIIYKLTIQTKIIGA